MTEQTKAGASKPVGAWFAAWGIACAVGACAAWAVVARPVERASVEARDRLERVARDACVRERQGGGVSDYVEMIADLRLQEEALKEWNNISADPAKVYDAIGTLAAEHGVRIERIEPRARGAGHVKGVSARMHGYSMDATGSYEQIARFLGGLEGDLGASKVVSFRMTPAFRAGAPVVQDGAATLMATIETAHVGAVAAVTEGGGGDHR